MMKTIGVIGLGAMGLGMAGSLRRAGTRIGPADTTTTRTPWRPAMR